MSQWTRRRRNAQNVKPGTAPGTISVGRHKLKPAIDVTVFSSKEFRTQKDVDIGDLQTPSKSQTIWVNVIGRGDANGRDRPI